MMEESNYYEFVLPREEAQKVMALFQKMEDVMSQLKKRAQKEGDKEEEEGKPLKKQSDRKHEKDTLRNAIICANRHLDPDKVRLTDEKERLAIEVLLDFSRKYCDEDINLHAVFVVNHAGHEVIRDTAEDLAYRLISWDHESENFAGFLKHALDNRVKWYKSKGVYPPIELPNQNKHKKAIFPEAARSVQPGIFDTRERDLANRVPSPPSKVAENNSDSPKENEVLLEACHKITAFRLLEVHMGHKGISSKTHDYIAMAIEIDNYWKAAYGRLAAFSELSRIEDKLLHGKG